MLLDPSRRLPKAEQNEPPNDIDPTAPCWPPTAAQPGTKEKVEVLRRRAEQGLPLWHPEDNLTPKLPKS
jgi:hypothetical protein